MPRPLLLLALLSARSPAMLSLRAVIGRQVWSKPGGVGLQGHQDGKGGTVYTLLWGLWRHDAIAVMPGRRQEIKLLYTEDIARMSQTLENNA